MDVHPSLLVGLTGSAAYLVYHKFEPDNLAAHALFLFVTPTLLAFALLRHFSSLLLTLCLTYTTYWATILLLTAAYRLSPFHPLSKFPGPILARVSKFWLAVVVSRGKSHEELQELHQQYGEIVRIGPNELSFARGDAINPVLMGKIIKKGPYYETRVFDEFPPLDGLREWSEHAVRRKPWARSMNMAALKGYDVILVEKIRELLERLEAMAVNGETIDISGWMGFFSFDFMGKMVFNHDFEMMKQGADLSGFRHLIDKGMTTGAPLSHVPWLMPLARVVPIKDIQAIRQFGKDVAGRRLKAGSDTKDLFYYLTGEDGLPEEKAVDTHFSMNTVKGDGLLAIVAGSDTSATALSHIWYFMLRHPHYLARLKKEVHDAFPTGEEPVDFARQADMPFLNACINEALRLYPPVLSGLQRRVESGTGGVIISDRFVPDYTQVSVHQYSVHRSPSHFYPLPDTYWPDRWLTQDTYTLPTGDVISKDRLTTDRGAFIPFSAGPQNCAGKSLAIMELRAVVCAVAQRFERMEVADGFRLDSWEENVSDIYVTKRGDLMVKLILQA